MGYWNSSSLSLTWRKNKLLLSKIWTPNSGKIRFFLHFEKFGFEVSVLKNGFSYHLGHHVTVTYSCHCDQGPPQTCNVSIFLARFNKKLFSDFILFASQRSEERKKRMCCLVSTLNFNFSSFKSFLQNIQLFFSSPRGIELKSLSGLGAILSA